MFYYAADGGRVKRGEDGKSCGLSEFGTGSRQSVPLGIPMMLTRTRFSDILNHLIDTTPISTT
jgi:hypothetical protein